MLAARERLARCGLLHGGCPMSKSRSAFAPMSANSHRNLLLAHFAVQSDGGPNDPKLTRPGRSRKYVERQELSN
jgi:hypothetical protein